MSSSSAAKRRHLATSPFQPRPEPPVEQFAVDELVSHDTYGVGRVIGTYEGVVTVDFRTQTVRIHSPFRKMEKL